MQSHNASPCPPGFHILGCGWKRPRRALASARRCRPVHAPSRSLLERAHIVQLRPDAPVVAPGSSQEVGEGAATLACTTLGRGERHVHGFASGHSRAILDVICIHPAPILLARRVSCKGPLQRPTEPMAALARVHRVRIAHSRRETGPGRRLRLRRIKACKALLCRRRHFARVVRCLSAWTPTERPHVGWLRSTQ